MGFIQISKQYSEPLAHRLDRRRRKEETFLFQNPKNTGKNNIIHEIESLPALPPQIYHIPMVPRGKNKPFSEVMRQTYTIYALVYLYLKELNCNFLKDFCYYIRSLFLII